MEFGPICIQPSKPPVWVAVKVRGRIVMRERKLTNYPMDEDCLNLNIYAPVVSQNFIVIAPPQ